MKKKLLVIALAFSMTELANAVAEPRTRQTILPSPEQPQAAVIAAKLLSRYHYKAVPLDDAMSEKIFDRYLKSLDPDKLFFTQADIDTFGAYRKQLDDAIQSGDLRVPFAIFNVYMQRTAERIGYSRELLNKPFDYTQNESYQTDREDAPWAKSEAEVADLWRKRVKNDSLRLKLAGKDDKAIRETLGKRYDSYGSRMAKLNSEDAFDIFMNAYAMSIEPHTNYLGPRASENFDITMKLSLEGIGAVLQSREDYTLIREIVPGSPAALSGKLKVGDRIMGIAQGADSAFTDVLGWRIDDVVKLVRGAKDTVVKLDVLPADASPDGKHVAVSLVRQKINMEEQAAKKSVLEVKDGGVARKVGVITLPGFYLDFDARRRGDADYRSATRDVERLLGELKKEKVESVLIDLRNNGGGALNEAVELTGLFIDKGPVVQQRNAQGETVVESDTHAGAAWNGPLGVLINRGSASASEIFAAAVQDYGRGVIIGEPSFGKGTVQTLVDIDRIIQPEKPVYGELKMTVAQFFRINGGTTQLRGVTPDIAFPSATDTKLFGESSYDNALPWTSVNAAYYSPYGDLKELLPILRMRHDARVSKDPDFKFLTDDVAYLKLQREKTTVSLNEAERRKQLDEIEARAKLRKQHLETAASKGTGTGDAAVKDRTRDDGLTFSERSLTDQLAAEKAAKDEKDIYLNEAVKIMADKVAVLKTDTRLAARVLPFAAPLRNP
jgi:carboxyl-terminal processing protease